MTIFFNQRNLDVSAKLAKPRNALTNNGSPAKRAETHPQSLVKKFTREYLFLSLIPIVSFFFCTAIGAVFAERYIADLLHSSNNNLSGYANVVLGG